jgi:hypothetical protein
LQLKYVVRLVLAVLCALAFPEVRSNAASLSIGLADKQVAIDTQRLSITPEDAATWDPAKYYVDASLGFVLKKPVSGNWLAPELLEGAEECLEARSGLLNQTLKEKFQFTLQTHPFGPMLQGVEAIRYTTNKTLVVELTDETTNDIAEEAIRKTVESEQILELNLGDQEIEKLKKNIRRSALSFEETTFVNELSVYVYDKKRLLGRPVEHSLAGFSIFILGQTAPKLDQLVADEHAVLAGRRVAIRGVLVNGEIGDFRAERVYMCTESKDRYYVVEIGFSPQTKNSQGIWNDIDKMLRSFAVFDQ